MLRQTLSWFHKTFCYLIEVVLLNLGKGIVDASFRKLISSSSNFHGRFCLFTSTNRDSPSLHLDFGTKRKIEVAVLNLSFEVKAIFLRADSLLVIHSSAE